jgi:hypothetical protein
MAVIYKGKLADPQVLPLGAMLLLIAGIYEKKGSETLRLASIPICRATRKVKYLGAKKTGYFAPAA